MKIRNLTYIALAVAVLVLCSWLTIPFTVPFTLQTFAVFAVLLILGGWRGSIAILIYLAMGALGLPVFSGFRGGIGHLLGPTGGYLFGFLLTGAAYLLAEKLPGGKGKLPGLAAGLLLCYLCGTLWFVYGYGTVRTQTTIGYALTVCVLPYILPDLAKLYLAFLVYKRVKKAEENQHE